MVDRCVGVVEGDGSLERALSPYISVARDTWHLSVQFHIGVAGRIDDKSVDYVRPKSPRVRQRCLITAHRSLISPIIY